MLLPPPVPHPTHSNYPALNTPNTLHTRARYFLRNAVEAQASELHLFLNSVPLLNPLSQEEKLQLVDAFEEQVYQPGEQVRVGVCRSPLFAVLWGHQS
jgi:hypothetical protein